MARPTPAANEWLVYILGAGASVPCGLPTMKDLWLRGLEEIEEQPLRFCMELWGSRFPGLDFEEALTWLLTHDEFDIPLLFTGNLASDARQLGIDWTPDLAPGMVRSILERLPEVAFTRMADLGRLGTYEALSRRIKSQVEAGAQVDVISFNWDTLFELAFEQVGTIDHYLAVQRPARGRPRIRLLKPHGSLGLTTCTNPSCIRDYARPTFASTRRDWYVARRPLSDPCPNCGQPRQPLIIPPNQWKTLPPEFMLLPKTMVGPRNVKDWYQGTWRLAYVALREATQTISLGYSWPASDFQARLQARQAFARGRHPLRVVTGAPAKGYEPDVWARAALRERVYRLFPNITAFRNSCTFDENGIEGFLTALNSA